MAAEEAAQVPEMHVEAELLPRSSRGAVEYVLAAWECQELELRGFAGRNERGPTDKL